MTLSAGTPAWDDGQASQRARGLFRTRSTNLLVIIIIGNLLGLPSCGMYLRQKQAGSAEHEDDVRGAHPVLQCYQRLSTIFAPVTGNVLCRISLTHLVL